MSDNESNVKDGKVVERPERRNAYVQLFLRKNKWNPLGKVDAKILNISKYGVKLEFARPVKLKEGEKVYLEIPFASYENQNEKTVIWDAICKWYRPEEYSAGFDLSNLSGHQKKEADELIEECRRRGLLVT